MTNVVLSTTGTGSSAHLTIVVKERRILPNLSEALIVQIARLKLWGLEEGARVNLTLRTDAAGSRRCSTHIKTC